MIIRFFYHNKDIWNNHILTALVKERNKKSLANKKQLKLTCTVVIRQLLSYAIHLIFNNSDHIVLVNQHQLRLSVFAAQSLFKTIISMVLVWSQALHIESTTHPLYEHVLLEKVFILLLFIHWCTLLACYSKLFN